MDMDTLLYLTWRTHKDLLDSTGSSAQYSVITLWSPGGKDGGGDSQGVWDGHAHTAVFNMENQQGPTGQHRDLCPVTCGSLGGRGAWGRRDPCVCVAESLCCPPETVTVWSVCCLLFLLGRQVLFNSLQPHARQHTWFPCPSLSPGGLRTFMSTDSAMPSRHFILSRPLLFFVVSLAQHQGLFPRVGSSH